MASISTYFDYAQYKSLDGAGAEVAKSKGIEVRQEVANAVGRWLSLTLHQGQLPDPSRHLTLCILYITFVI
ncbi:hypothetical protein [Nostoc sp. DedQUE09]|uniref:hypothetical protein n=1 Tax=Nostoc sp. DedQUE09 TaxID=3075394 RepID=UPI002AD49772|nr:hypothetical protein [Nostoc sp. DedQUE09]MDZ7952111.1 hypothetical protein [Nostoc sp. DedQUE09]